MNESESDATVHQRWLDTSWARGELRGRAVRGGRTTALAQIVQGLVEVGSTLVLARLIVPESFGLIGMVTVVTGFVSMFKDLGLSAATVQRSQITHAQVSALFWINVAFGLVLMLGVAAVSPMVSLLYGRPELTTITIALSAGLVLSGVGVQHLALLNRQMAFGRRAAIEFCSSVIAVGVALAMAYQGLGYWSLVAKIVVTAGLTSVGAWIACSWRPARPSRCRVSSLVRFGRHLAGFNIIQYLARNLDDLLIGRVYGELALGLYQEAYRILRVPLTKLNAPLGAVSISALSRMLDDPAGYRRTYCRVLEKILLITMPLGAFVVGTSEHLIVFLLGDQWVDAGPILTWLGLLMFTQPIGNSTGWLFITQDRTKELLRWGVIGSVLSMLSFFVGLPWGALGVAIAYSSTGIIVRLPILIWLVGKKGPVRGRDVWSTAFAPTSAGVVALLTVLLVQSRLNGAGLSAEWTPAAHTLVGFVITSVTAGATLLLLPTGRAAINDAWDLLWELRLGGRGAGGESQ